jgi:hypothetical protein
MPLEAVESPTVQKLRKYPIFTSSEKRITAALKDITVPGGVILEETLVTPYVQMWGTKIELLAIQHGLGIKAPDGSYQPVELPPINNTSGIPHKAEATHYVDAVDPLQEWFLLKLMELNPAPTKYWSHELTEVRKLLASGDFSIKNGNFGGKGAADFGGRANLLVQFKKRRNNKGQHQNQLTRETGLQPADTRISIARLRGELEEVDNLVFLPSADIDEAIYKLSNLSISIDTQGINRSIRSGIYSPSVVARNFIKDATPSIFKSIKRGVVLLGQQAISDIKSVVPSQNDENSYLEEDEIIDRPDDEIYP